MPAQASGTLNEPSPRKSVLAIGACAAAVMAGFVWSNLLSGEHREYVRSAAPEPVKVERSRPKLTAGKTKNAYPSSSVSVSVAKSEPQVKARGNDPLAQLILQTGSIAPAGERAVQNSAATMVLDAQRALAALDFYRGPIDGLVGSSYEAAVKAYQEANAMSVSGVVTRPVLDHMQMAVQVADATQTDVTVHKVQQVLMELGYSPGQVDGRMGEQTRKAIKVFESDRGWAVTGEISVQLLAELAGSQN